MADFSALLASFRNELNTWAPSEQSFEDSLMKAQIHGCGTVEMTVTDAQKWELREIYNEAKRQEKTGK